MDEGKKSNIIPALLVIILFAGLGFGGYFTGQYLDAQSAKKQAEEVIRNKPATYTFNNSKLGVKFTYPSNWNLALDEETSPSAVIVTNATGSQFVFTKGTEVDQDIAICDEKDPDGLVEGNKPCFFVKGTEIEFARYKDTEATNDDGDVWNVLEPGDEENPNTYLLNRSNYFYYVSKSDTDLTALDNILKSVERI